MKRKIILICSTLVISGIMLLTVWSIWLDRFLLLHSSLFMISGTILLSFAIIIIAKRIVELKERVFFSLISGIFLGVAIMILLDIMISLIGADYIIYLSQCETPPSFLWTRFACLISGITIALLFSKYRRRIVFLNVFIWMAVILVLFAYALAFDLMFKHYENKWTRSAWPVSKSQIEECEMKSDLDWPSHYDQMYSYLLQMKADQGPLRKEIRDSVDKEIANGFKDMMCHFDSRRIGLHEACKKDFGGLFSKIPPEESTWFGFPIRPVFFRMILFRPTHKQLENLDRWGSWLRTVPDWSGNAFAWYEACGFQFIKDNFFFSPMNVDYCDFLILDAQRRLVVAVDSILSFHSDYGKLPDEHEIANLAIPIDPYTERPMVYKKQSATEFLIYSSGPDAVDDGGIRLVDDWYKARRGCRKGIPESYDMGFQMKLEK